MRGFFCPFSEKKDSGYDLGVGVKGEIKGDILVCSLGEGDWGKHGYKLRAFFEFHYYYCLGFPHNYYLLLDNESYYNCVVGEVGLGRDY